MRFHIILCLNEADDWSKKPANDIKAFFYFQSLLIKELVNVSVLGIIKLHQGG